jgi:hypothetical protein
MAHDYGDLHDIGDLSDRELRDLVREQLVAHKGIDPDDVTVTVDNGTVTLEGRVGTDVERSVVDHLLTDVLGLQQFANNLVVDSIRRATSPEAIDDHLADEEDHDGILLGDRAVPFSSESQHLADDPEPDLDGTTDVQRVMEDGATWSPPEMPTPEGRASGFEDSVS